MTEEADRDGAGDFGDCTGLTAAEGLSRDVEGAHADGVGTRNPDSRLSFVAGFLGGEPPIAYLFSPLSFSSRSRQFRDP